MSAELLALRARALEHHCRLGCETAYPRFGLVVGGGRRSIILSVNSGYE
jgi:hypothetical protein